MITWLGQPRSWLAQEQSPEGAAGRAAYDRAQDSAWPPTEDDFAAVGAAAGTAAGAIICAPGVVTSALCAAAGTIIGGAVGSAVFQLGSAIAGGLDPRGTAEAFYAMVARCRYLIDATEQLNLAITRLAALRAGRPVPEESAPREPSDPLWHEEAESLVRYGLGIRIDPSTNNAAPAVDFSKPDICRSYPEIWKRSVDKFGKDLFAAVAARAAEIETIKMQQPALSPSGATPGPSGATPVIVGTLILAGVAWALLT